MSYLVKEMWLYLGTAMIGTLVLGVLFGRTYLASALERAQKNWETRTRAAEDAANTKLRGLEEAYTEELEQNASQLSALTTDLQSQRARVSSLRDEVSKWRDDFNELQAEHEGTNARLRTLDDRLAAALEDSDQLDLERKRLRSELERRGSELTKAMEESAEMSKVVGQVEALQVQATQQTVKIQELTSEVTRLQATIRKQKADSADLQSQLERSSRTVAQREERIRGLSPLEHEVSEAREQVDLLRSEHESKIARRDEEATRLRSRVGELEPMAARVVVLGGQLAEKTAALTSLESQLAALSGFPDRLKESEQELARAREASRELEADLARLRGELERSKRKPKPLTTEKSSNGGLHLHDVRDLVKAIDSASARGAAEAHETSDIRQPVASRQPLGREGLGTPQSDVSPIPVSASPAVVRESGLSSALPDIGVVKDDLKRISGIGPKLESRLHGLGYLTYHQIARWSDEDIDRVEHHLPGFPDRIRRDDWIGQARRLEAETKGDDLSV